MHRLCSLLLVLPLLAGCADLKADADESPHPFASTPSIESILSRSAVATESADAKLSDLTAKIDRTNELLAEFVSSQKLSNGQQCDLLDQIKSLKASSPIPPEPPKAVSTRSSRQAGPGVIRTKDGQQWNLSDFLESYYRYPVFVEGMTVDEHLQRDHGVSYDPSLSQSDKEKLHAASHEYEKSGSRQAPRASTITGTDCQSGQCQVRSKSVTVTTPESTRSRSVSVYESQPVQTYSAPVYGYSWSRSSAKCNGRRCRR